MKSVAELQELFNKALQSFALPDKPVSLYSPFHYMLSLGGKRLRPVLVLMACDLVCDEAERALPQALAIELFHNFTLVHDDIMDEAPLRRGLQTVHKKFSMNAAILSGDVMLVYAYVQLLQTNSSIQNAVMKLFNKTAIEVCEGQQLDVDFENRMDVTLSEYLNMITLKTSVLLAGSLKIGAMIGGANEADCDHFYAFGKHTGIAFQLQDDILDSFGDQKFGKQIGGDILMNKKTYLLISALENASPSERNELKDRLNEKNNSTEKIDAILSIYKKLKVREKAEAEKQKHFELALRHLNSLSYPGERKENLRKFAVDLLERKL